MPYEIAKDAEHSVIVLRVTGRLSLDTINTMFNDCARQMQDFDGIASLVIDLAISSMENAHTFAQAIIIFHRTSTTFKPDAPIYYALVGHQSTLMHIMDELEALRFHAPTFDSVAEAVTYLNLRVGSAYLRQTRHPGETNELETLYISRRHTDEMYFGAAIPGTAEFPGSGVLRVEEVDTGQCMLLFPNGDMCIGRQEKGRRKPDVDLSMWGAFHKGVSREHARILREGNELLLMDTDSTNGTSLNGNRVDAHEVYVLHDGDQLTFGSLAVRVFFQPTMQIP